MLDKDSHGKSNVNMPSSLQVGRLAELPASDFGSNYNPWELHT